MSASEQTQLSASAAQAERILEQLCEPSLRVIGGELRGFRLAAPRNTLTRPTSDKAREAIFDVLGDLVSDATVLDLYAGSGAMAIEALSRGAIWAELVEANRHACAVINRNLTTTGLTQRSRLWCLDVTRALDKVRTQFDIILIDPPYSEPRIQGVMTVIGRLGIAKTGAAVVLEHSKRLEPDATYGALSLIQAKRYGDTAVSFFRAATLEE